MVTKSRGMVAAALLVLAMTGCVAQAPEQTPPPQPGETETPAPVFEPLAGGDCDVLLDSAEVASALGGSTVVNESFTGEGIPQIAIVGGLQCSWAFGEQGAVDATTVSLSVVPADIAEPGEIDNAAANVCEQGTDLMSSNRGCLVDTTSSGWWYELHVHTFTTAQGQSDSSRAVDSLVQLALGQATPPAKIEALPVVDCASVIPGATNSEEPVTADAGVIAIAADRLARPTECSFPFADGSVGDAIVFPGSTVGYDLCLKRDRGEAATVAGVEHAYTEALETVLNFCGSDGTSSVTIYVIDARDQDTAGWTDALRAKAGAFAAPLLAAASA